MSLMRNRSVLAAVALCACSSAQALDLGKLLRCAEPDAFMRTPREIELALAPDARASCRTATFETASTMECTLSRPLSAFGLPTGEFAVSRLPDRTQRVRITFRSGPERVGGAVASALGVRLEPGPENSRVAQTASPPLRVTVAEREDGSTTVSCERVSATEGTMPGVDAQHGAISGTLGFPRSPVPPMRVCAIHASGKRAHCVRSRAAQTDYLIGNLTPGEYYLVAYPLADNPEGWTAVHSSRFTDCPPFSTGCAQGIIKRVYVRAGHVLTDVDPDSFYTALPAHLQQPPPEAG